MGPVPLSSNGGSILVSIIPSGQQVLLLAGVVMGGRRKEVSQLTAKAATRDWTSGKSSPGNVCRDNDNWLCAIMAGVITAGLKVTTPVNSKLCLIVAGVNVSVKAFEMTVMGLVNPDGFQ